MKIEGERITPEQVDENTGARMKQMETAFQDFIKENMEDGQKFLFIVDDKGASEFEPITAVQFYMEGPEDTARFFAAVLSHIAANNDHEVVDYIIQRTHQILSGVDLEGLREE